MQPIHFVYWLQGYLEITDAGQKPQELTKDQIACIKKHLALVLTPVTQAPAAVNVPTWTFPNDIVISPLGNDTIIGYDPDLDLTITAKPL